MPSLRIGKDNKNLCPRCNKPIARKGIHNHCRRKDEFLKTADYDNMHLARMEKKFRDEMLKKVKRWNPSMGKDLLKQMFPDMEDRM